MGHNFSLLLRINIKQGPLFSWDLFNTRDTKMDNHKVVVIISLTLFRLQSNICTARITKTMMGWQYETPTVFDLPVLEICSLWKLHSNYSSNTLLLRNAVPLTGNRN